MFSVAWKSDFNFSNCPFSKKRSKKKMVKELDNISKIRALIAAPQ